jgi:hypothetical protein
MAKLLAALKRNRHSHPPMPNALRLCARARLAGRSARSCGRCPCGQISSRPRLCSRRNPLAVMPPFGKATFAAVSRRSGVSGSMASASISACVTVARLVMPPPSTALLFVSAFQQVPALPLATLPQLVVQALQDRKGHRIFPNRQIGESKRRALRSRRQPDY